MSTPEMNGNPPEPPPDGEFTIDDLITAAGNALHSAAENGAGSNDPDAALRFAQAGNQWALAIKELLPPKPDPGAQVRAEADVTKAGAQLAHDQTKHEMQLEHDQAQAEVAAVRSQGNNSRNG